MQYYIYVQCFGSLGVDKLKKGMRCHAEPEGVMLNLFQHLLSAGLVSTSRINTFLRL